MIGLKNIGMSTKMASSSSHGSDTSSKSNYAIPPHKFESAKVKRSLKVVPPENHVSRPIWKTYGTILNFVAFHYNDTVDAILFAWES